MKTRQLLFFALTALLVAATAQGATDHAKFVKGPFKSGPKVTKACLDCHEKEAKDFMKTAHWTWSSEQNIKGGKKTIGKKNVINNFCISLPSNWPRCTSCHAGYGWKDGQFDFTRATNIDCLVCHDTTGTYRKFPTDAGHPAYQDKEFGGKPWKAVDLLKVAQSVGAPSRATCGSCHFYGGGGDHIKHGDLDSSLIKPTAQIDVHMGRGMTCQSCHKTKKHAIPGNSLLISQGEGTRVACTDCHTVEPHQNQVYNRHARRVACQTCHIPTIARAMPTKVWWDWSKAGRDVKEPPKDKFGLETYAKMKGEFRWDKDFSPSYSWYNGSVERYLPGDKIDPAKVVNLNRPLGDRNDTSARIMPFKVMHGKQPFDKLNNHMVYVNVFGPDGYWKTYDWKKSIENGMKAGDLPVSGEYGFVETSMVWKVTHMVAPKQMALTCNDCHGAKGRLDWQALGYPGDPKKE